MLDPYAAFLCVDDAAAARLLLCLLIIIISLSSVGFRVFF